MTFSPIKPPHPPAPQKHRWLDLWLIARGEALIGIAQGMVDHLEGLEATLKPRRRKRKDADQAAFKAIVTSLATNLAYAVLLPPETGRLGVNGGNLNRPLTRYDNRHLASKQFRTIIDLMHEDGWLDFRTPPTRVGRGEKSSIAVTTKFKDLISSGSVSLADFGGHPDEELIILSAWTGPAGNRRKPRVDYQDSPETTAMRAAIRHLNAFLGDGDIAFPGRRQAPLSGPP